MAVKRLRDRDDSLLSYFRSIKQTTLLTFEEELDLSRRIERGDHPARQRLIESNLRLVVRIARKYVTPDVALLDLVQEGNMGLIRAASKYDHRKQVRFSTYASWWIKQAIVRSLSNKRRVIRLPHRKEEKLRKINKVYNTLAQELMRTPTVEEIAKDLGMTHSEVSVILSMAGGVASLDSTTGEDSGTLQDVIEDNTYAPDAQLVDKSLREETLRVLDRLKDRERQILLRRFAFFGGKKHTLKSIGEDMGISPETVRQIELRALKKLKEVASDLDVFVHN